MKHFPTLDYMYICNLFLSLMCESAAFVEALLYVILKAPAIFFSVTAIGHPFSRSSKKFTVNFIYVQVAL